MNMEKQVIDLSETIVPKSDQLNADDLIGGARTIKVREVKKIESEQQPVSIYFEGDNNKPYKPSKGMRRVLIQLWGSDGALYVGRHLTIFRDESVKWAGEEVGGIIISHLSNIDALKKIAVTVGRGKKKMITIIPLNYTEPAPLDTKPAIDELNACKTLKELQEVYVSLSTEEKSNALILAKKDELKTKLK